MGNKSNKRGRNRCVKKGRGRTARVANKGLAGPPSVRSVLGVRTLFPSQAEQDVELIEEFGAEEVAAAKLLAEDIRIVGVLQEKRDKRKSKLFKESNDGAKSRADSLEE